MPLPQVCLVCESFQSIISAHRTAAFKGCVRFASSTSWNDLIVSSRRNALKRNFKLENQMDGLDNFQHLLLCSKQLHCLMLPTLLLVIYVFTFLYNNNNKVHADIRKRSRSQ